VSDRLELLREPWRERVTGAVDWLRERGFTGRAGLILGSGLGNFVDAMLDVEAVDYAEIPGFTRTTVAEHKGRMVRGMAADLPVIVMQGRLHPYESLPADEMLLPTAVLACLGVDAVILTNAAGGLNRFFVPGDLMIIRDQLDFHMKDPLATLVRPPAGPPRGARPDALYDADLALALAAAGAAAGVPLHSGVYASMWGPAYETRAEIGMLRRVGCDAVGMSTAPEAALLARLGVKVAGLSCITNPSREVGQPELSHADVVEVGLMVRDRMARLLLDFLPRLAAG